MRGIRTLGRRRRTRLAVVASIAVLLSLRPPVARARSLAERLHVFIDENAFVSNGVIADTFTPIVERLAARGTDLPAASTTPGFTFQFDPELGTFERSSLSLGPVFVERAETIGKGGLAVGATDLHGDLVDRDGKPLLLSIVVKTNRFGPELRTSFRFDDFHLSANVFSLFATYGVTSRWDVNLLLPLVDTSLDVETTRIGVVEGGRSRVDRPELHAESFGPGDLLLRTKYRLGTVRVVGIASGLSIRLSTGSEGDFHGIGDYTVTPFLVASWPHGHQDVHGSIGVETNADDLERTRARYAIGASLSRWDRVAFLLDVVGSSSFVDDEFDIVLPTALLNVRNPDIKSRQETAHGTRFIAAVPRGDFVDLALGMKVNVVKTAILFVTAIVPLTRDGLRAEVIPGGGLEFTF